MDLGLPSGLLWAKTNIGASSPEQLGLYFSWGNSPGHAEGSGYDFSQEVYNETPGAVIGADLTLAEDMARISLGAPWRLPTDDEFQELFENCTSVWVALGGVEGRLFTSNVNGNSIFFPAAGGYNGTTNPSRGLQGYYWSSSYHSEMYAYYLNFNSSSVNPQYHYLRSSGFSVRAVFKP